MTRREAVDTQLNATALAMIQKSLTPKDMSHIRTCSTAKEAWDYLTNLFVGNASIQGSRLEEKTNESDGFAMLDEEDAEEMYRRLKALCVAMKDLGAYYVDDNWVKRKFVQALLPFEESKLNSIKGRSNYFTMTSGEVLSEVIAMKIAKKNVDIARARANGLRQVNLALKATVEDEDEGDVEDNTEWSPEDTKYEYNDHMALAAKAFWSKKGKNFNSRGQANVL
jgi:hypothetical protein